MSATWLIVDANALASQAFHAMGHLSTPEEATGMLFGFFRDIINLKELFDTNRMAFCFDYGKNLRLEEYPEYKKTRKAKNEQATEEEKAAKHVYYDQLEHLRGTLLPAIGFRNIFAVEGFEADDLIAALTRTHITPPDRAIIITSDEDMYQCLRNNVDMYSLCKKKIITKRSFIQEYGVAPFAWAKVKALAGCLSDDIPGVKGIGEKTAIKYIREELDCTSVSYRKIKDSDYSLWLRLVKLPYHKFGLRGLREFDQDKLNHREWEKLVTKYAMTSLARSRPI